MQLKPKTVIGSNEFDCQWSLYLILLAKLHAVLLKVSIFKQILVKFAGFYISNLMFCSRGFAANLKFRSSEYFLTYFNDDNECCEWMTSCYAQNVKSCTHDLNSKSSLSTRLECFIVVDW